LRGHHAESASSSSSASYANHAGDLLDGRQKRSEFQIQRKYLPYPFGLVVINGELGVDHVVTKEWHAARPFAFASRSRDLVASSFGNHFALELREGHQHVKC
jgi:hypothetical protein